MEDPERARCPGTKVEPGRMHLARLERLRGELRRIGCAGPVLYDPITIPYATGTSNTQVFALQNHCPYTFVSTDGPVVLFDLKGCEHLSKHYPAVDEARDAVSWYHFVTGDRLPGEGAFLGRPSRRSGQAARRAASLRLEFATALRVNATGYQCDG